MVAALVWLHLLHSDSVIGFNPCKGFGVVAAAAIRLERMPGSCFNPCKGFGVVAAVPANPAGVQLAQQLVSIPVRVLGWLQPFNALDRTQRYRSVSIPVRVLGWLQLAGTCHGSQ